MRIGVSLIDAATGFNRWSQVAGRRSQVAGRWSQVFDRTMKDISAVQSEITDTVATTLAARARSFITIAG